MRSKKAIKLTVLIAFVMTALIPACVLAAETVSIEGEVNDSFQIVAGNGQVYEVANTTKGNELVENYIGEKVKVSGTVEKDGEVQVITVMTFQTLAE